MQSILTLPEKTIEVQELEFTAQEREIYSAIEFVPFPCPRALSFSALTRLSLLIQIQSSSSIQQVPQSRYRPQEVGLSRRSWHAIRSTTDSTCHSVFFYLISYACVLTMLLRLRQLCNHPQLLARAKGEGIAPNDLLLQAENENPEAAARNAENAEMAKLSEIERAIKIQGEA